MKQTFYIFIFILTQTLTFGQINSTVSNIFYNLPLDKSRADLREIIASDKRFVSTDTVSNIMKFTMPYFLGTIKETSIVKSNPDSTEIHLSFGSSTFSRTKGGEKDFIPIMFLSLKYYYSNIDSVKVEYDKLLKLLQVELKESSDTKMESTQSQFKAIGKLFENFNPYYSVEVLSASVTNNVYGLYIEFRREEK
jgi:hypothetical protein